MPALDAYLLDDQAEQSLALVEVERVDPVCGLLGEVGDALAEAVADGEFVTLGCELGLLGLELAAAAVEFGCSTVEFGHVDVTGLVEVGDPSALGGCLVHAAGEAGELSVEDLVVRRGLLGDECAFAGEQHVGAQQDVADLREHERVEFVGADPPLGAALIDSACAQRVVVVTAVVPVLAGAVLCSGAHRMCVRLDVARSAVNEPRSSQVLGGCAVG